MEEKKKSKSLLPVVILLTILVLGLVGYICYDKGLILSKTEQKESKVEEVKKTETWKDIELDDSRFYSLYTTLKGFTYDRSRGAGYKDFNSMELAYLAFGTAEVSKDDFTIISVDNYNGVTKASFDANIVMKEIKEIFNEDSIEIDYNSIKELYFLGISRDYGLKFSDNYVSGCGFAVDSYDKSSNKLVVNFNTSGCGGTSGPSAKINERKIISAKEKDDTIIVKEKAIYYQMNGYDNNIVYNIYGDNTKDDYLGDVKTTEEEVSNVIISVDSYIDKASTITHTYKLNPKTNKYYFVSSTIN
ncbi:MAG: hypothetical protein J6A17_02295 [Bacilli bacterium]|nr:hypothetical protein [Bacilli bacterium]